MRTWLFIGAFLLLGFQVARGQDAPNSSRWGEELSDFQKNGMLALGTWAIGNFAVSGYQMTRTKGSTYHFHEMNVLWNTVNLGIAVGGYLGASDLPSAMSSPELMQEYQNFSKILLFNTGLDVAYVMTGLYLRERSSNVSKHSNRLRGYGNSLMLQGAFLFAFDLVLVLINEHNIKELTGSDQFQAVLTPGAFRFTWNF